MSMTESDAFGRCKWCGNMTDSVGCLTLACTANVVRGPVTPAAPVDEEAVAWLGISTRNGDTIAFAGSKRPDSVPGWEFSPLYARRPVPSEPTREGVTDAAMREAEDWCERALRMAELELSAANKMGLRASVRADAARTVASAALALSCVRATLPRPRAEVTEDMVTRAAHAMGRVIDGAHFNPDSEYHRKFARIALAAALTGGSPR